MAHYAVLGDDGKTVINMLEYEGSSPESNWVEYSDDDVPTIVKGSCYKQGAANTWSGQKPFDSWTYSESANTWEPPVAKPSDHDDYAWNESTGAWVDLRPEVVETTQYVLNDTATLGDKRISGVGSTMVFETYNGTSWVDAGTDWSLLSL